MSNLIAIPVYNEQEHLADVLRQTLTAGQPILVVNDGSTDGTAQVLDDFPQVRVVHHPTNRGYGAALHTAFEYAIEHDVEFIVTIDSDGQHHPGLIGPFLAACQRADIVSGSRYLSDFEINTPAPKDRRRINMLVTDQLNACLGFSLTDSFCGFKAYRTSALKQLIPLHETGYGMPLELWVKAACQKLNVIELAVPRVYLDENRSFGETLDNANLRLDYYQSVIDRALAEVTQQKPGDCGLRRPTLVLSAGDAS